MNALRPAKTQIRRWFLRSIHSQPITTTTTTTIHHNSSRGLSSAAATSSSMVANSLEYRSRRRAVPSSSVVLAAVPVHDVRSFHSTAKLFEGQDAAVADAAHADAPVDDTNAKEDETETPDEPHPTDIQYVFAPPPPLSEDSQKQVNDLFDKILYLDMIEVHLLTQVVNEQLGISWNQLDYSGGGPGVAAAGGAGGAMDEPPEKEKLFFELKLVGFDAKAKIKVIKEVRAILGLGLKEAKELVESAPKVIQKDLKPEKAQELKEKLEAVGAQIEIE
jgi:large subunit ribosomal protein L7/L12